MKSLLSMLLLSLAGCAHIRNSAASAPASASTEVAVVRPAKPENSSGTEAGLPLPPEFEEYYVGMIADAENPDFFYRPGTFLVRTSAGRRDRPEQDAGSGPQTTSRSTDWHPQPLAAEWSAIAAHSERALGRLMEENERLRARVPALEKPVATPAPGGTPAAAGSVPQVAEAAIPDDSHLVIVRPNRENTIELDPGLLVAPAPQTSNPFVQRYQPPVALREVSLVVSATVPGPHGSVVLNDVAYGIGDRIEGLEVYRIEPDTAFLLKNSFLLACPVSEKPVKLHLP